MNRLLIVLMCLVPLGATAAKLVPPPTISGYTYAKTVDGIREYRLDSNGLTVLLAEDHSAPVVTFNVTYHVGSRNEVTGTTGATHFLEHLMFKGSDKYNRTAGTGIDQYLERVGAEYNATTWNDRTNYYGTLGKDQLEGYVAIEADRMRNLWLHENDRNAEMTVVRNEFERGKNEPNNVLQEEVAATAYQALPYHHSTIGWRSDIEKVPMQKLRDFYDTFYWPDNATVTVVGDFDPAATLKIVQKYYGVYPKAPHGIPSVYTEEPEQRGARRVIVKRAGDLGTILIAHKVPNARHSDQAALAVLDGILGIGKNSRLYRALVEKSLALEVSANTELHYDLSLHGVTAALAPNAKHEAVEKIMLAEIEAIKTQGVSADEVARVKSLYAAQQAYKRDGVTGVAAEINEWIAVGDWTLYSRFPAAIAAVTAADVQHVAKAYLNVDQSTTGWFVPVADDKG